MEKSDFMFFVILVPVLILCVPFPVACGTLRFHQQEGKTVINYRHVESVVSGAPREERPIAGPLDEEGPLSLGAPGEESEELVRRVRSVDGQKNMDSGKTPAESPDADLNSLIAFLAVGGTMALTCVGTCLVLRSICCCVKDSAQNAGNQMAHKYVPGTRLDAAGNLQYYQPSPEEIQAVQGVATGLLPGKVGQMISQVKAGDMLGAPVRHYDDPPPPYYSRDISWDRGRRRQSTHHQHHRHPSYHHHDHQGQHHDYLDGDFHHHDPHHAHNVASYHEKGQYHMPEIIPPDSSPKSFKKKLFGKVKKGLSPDRGKEFWSPKKSPKKGKSPKTKSPKWDNSPGTPYSPKKKSPAKKLFGNSPDSPKKRSPLKKLFGKSPDSPKKKSPAKKLFGNSPDSPNKSPKKKSPLRKIFGGSPKSPKKKSPAKKLFGNSPRSPKKSPKKKSPLKKLFGKKKKK